MWSSGAAAPCRKARDCRAKAMKDKKSGRSRSYHPALKHRAESAENSAPSFRAGWSDKQIRDRINSADSQCCALCEREVSRVSRHHLVPKSEGGTFTVDLCAACHKTLHSFFTNRTLAKE